MFTNFKRILKLAFVDFYRNKGISVAAIFVMVITIFVMTGLFFIHGIGNHIITEVQNKIDITAYFKTEAEEVDILQAKDQLMNLVPQIKDIQYVSKEDALALFTQRHQDNLVFSDALTEVGGNPFLPSLNITTADSAEQYQKIADILEGDQFSDIIDNVDFSQKKDTIDKVFSIISSINLFGIGLAVVFLLVAAVIVFNTVKLAIENSKEEISTMRIVGATTWFVQGPFIIQGVIFGIISFLICFIATGFLAYFLSGGLALALAGFNLFGYFLSNIFLIILIQLGFGVALSAATSFIVVRKYLKV